MGEAMENDAGGGGGSGGVEHAPFMQVLPRRRDPWMAAPIYGEFVLCLPLAPPPPPRDL